MKDLSPDRNPMVLEETVDSDKENAVAPRFQEAFKDAAERAEAAKWSSARRQARIESMLVRYPTFNNALANIANFHRPVRDGSAGVGKIGGLLGESRSGKTTALTSYVRSLGNVEKPGVLAPKAIYVNATKSMSPNALADALCARMGISRRSRGNAGQHLGICTDEIVHCGIELVVIDNAQWLLRSRFTRTIEDTFSFLIDTAERRTCNVLVSGTPSIQHVVEADEHARGRGDFPHKFVEPFDWYTPDGRKAFRGLLSTIGTYLPFRDLPAFADERISAHFYKLTGGLIGRVMNYVEAAAFAAINDGAYTVETKHLAYAAESRRRVNDPFVPFVSHLDIDDPGEVIDDGEPPDEPEPPARLVKRSRTVASAKGRLATSDGRRPDGR